MTAHIAEIHRNTLDAMSRPLYQHLIDRGVNAWDAKRIATAFSAAFGHGAAQTKTDLFLDAGWQGNEIGALLTFDDRAWREQPQTLIDAERVLLGSGIDATCARAAVITKPDYGIESPTKLQNALSFLRGLGLTAIDLGIIARKYPQSFYQSSERLEQIRDAAAKAESDAEKHKELLRYLLEKKDLQPSPRSIPRPIKLCGPRTSRRLIAQPVPMNEPMDEAAFVAVVPILLVVEDSGNGALSPRETSVQARAETDDHTGSEPPGGSEPEPITTPMAEPYKISGTEPDAIEPRRLQTATMTDEEIEEEIERRNLVRLSTNLNATLRRALQTVKPDLTDHKWEKFRKANPDIFDKLAAVSMTCLELQRWINLPERVEEAYLGKILAHEKLRQILATPAPTLQVRMSALRKVVGVLDGDFIREPALLLLPFETILESELRLRMHTIRDKNKGLRRRQYLPILLASSREVFQRSLDTTVATE